MLIQQYNVLYGIQNFFYNMIAELAEEEDHHPKIILEWGLVTLQWWSHKIKGLHMNDFICAAKSDEIYNSFE